MLRVHKIGTPVDIRGGVRGWIKSVSVIGEENRISYEVRWWDNTVLNAEWFDPSELDFKTTNQPMKIGFDA